MNNEFTRIEQLKQAVDSYADLCIQYRQDPQNYLYVTAMISDLRKMAAAGLRIKSDAEEFSKTVQTYVNLQIDLMNGYDKGMGVDASFITMTSFYYGLDALASGNISLGRKYFSIIGGRHKEEKRNDNPFIRAFGYAIKELATTGRCTDSQIVELRRVTKQKYLLGYLDIIAGISNRDLPAINSGINWSVRMYPTCIRAGNIFHLTPDANVFYWCAGFINLARHLNLNIIIPEIESIPKCIVNGRLG